MVRGFSVNANPLTLNPRSGIGFRVDLNPYPSWAIRAAKKPIPNLHSFRPILWIPVRESKGIQGGLPVTLAKWIPDSLNPGGGNEYRIRDCPTYDPNGLTRQWHRVNPTRCCGSGLARPLDLGLYKIFVHAIAFLHLSIIIVLPPPYALLTLSPHDCTTNAQDATPHLTPLVYAVHHTILGMTISCKGQARPQSPSRLTQWAGPSFTV